MRNFKGFKGLLFWESLFIGISIVIWGIAPPPNNSDVLAAIAAVALVATLALAVALAAASGLRLLPVVASVAVEFTAIFLLFNYGWPAAAVTGILILLGMKFLPEKLVVRPV